MEVYQIILQQLGGKRFIVMTGSKNLGYSSKDDNYLSMHLTKNKIRAKYLKITLMPNDTYTMVFSTTKKTKVHGFVVDETHVILKTIENVYCDQLQEIFTEVTGLYTYL